MRQRQRLTDRGNLHPMRQIEWDVVAPAIKARRIRLSLSQVDGCVLELIRAWDLLGRTLIVPPVTLKKFATGKGIAPKEAKFTDVPRQLACASMLHVHPGTIAQMMKRGNTLLERHPDGGIVRGSVMREIVRRAELRDDR